MDTVIYGILGCGGLAAAVYFLVPMISKIFGGGDGKVREAVHKITQKISREKISKIESDQTVVAVKVKNKESLAEESVTRIKDIQKKAAEEIEEVLKEDRIADIHKTIDEEWDNL